jgi:tetratricopeptide (TPR) repeat protein
MEAKIPLDVDHSKIAQFDSTSARGYRKVLGKLKQFEQDAPAVIATRFGKKTPAVLNSNDRDGRKAYEAEDWTQASELLKKALEERDHHELDTYETAESRWRYAYALYRLKEYDKAIYELRKSVSWSEEKNGREHLETAKMRMWLGKALEGNRRSTDASQEFMQAASIFERDKRGADTLESLQCRYKHGILASEHEAYDRQWPHWLEAEESLRRAAQGFARLPNPEGKSFKARISYATVLLKMCRDKEALEQFTELLRIAEQKNVRSDIEDIKLSIEECRFWLGKSQASRLADRRPMARKRAKERQKEAYERKLTGRWSTPQRAEWFYTNVLHIPI